MIKRILALLFVILIPLSIISCDNDIPKIKAKNKSNKNVENTYVMKYPKAYYDIESKEIKWDAVDKAEEYEINIYLINETINTKTQNTYYDVSNLTPGIFSVSIKPIDTDNKYKAGKETKYNVKIPGFNKDMAYEKVEEELIYSIVLITVTRYDSFLGIKTNKTVEQKEGVICKKSNGSYWAITNCPLLKSNTKYDKTEITVKDTHNNTYTGTEINPTNISNGILSVISFNSNIQLPIVNFAEGIGINNEEVMFVSRYQFTNKAQFAKTTEIQPSTNNDISTKYHVVITDKINNSSFSVATFNDEYELIGITVNLKNNQYCFIQIKEILEYIDKELAEKTGYASKTIIPVDVKPPSVMS